MTPPTLIPESSSPTTAGLTPTSNHQAYIPFNSCFQRHDVTTHYRNERIGGDVALPEAWRVNLDDALLARLREWLQPENVQVLY